MERGVEPSAVSWGLSLVASSVAGRERQTTGFGARQGPVFLLLEGGWDSQISGRDSQREVTVPSSWRIASMNDFLPRFFGAALSSSWTDTSG